MSVEVQHGIAGRSRDDDGQVVTCLCGKEMFFRDCWSCDGEGGHDGEWLKEHNAPLWFDDDDWEPCDICQGERGWWTCYSFWSEDDQ